MAGGTVDFQLENPVNAQLLAQDEHELTIDPPAPPQTVTVEFVAANFNFAGDTPGAQSIGVTIITSDGQPLVNPVQVDVRDLLTGSASTPGDYTMATPQTLNWAASDPDGTIQSAVITIAGVNGPTETVDLDLDNVVGATEGAQNTATVFIINIGA